MTPTTTGRTRSGVVRSSAAGRIVASVEPSQQLTFRRALAIIGAVLVVAGAIAWISAANALQPATWYSDAAGIARANAWMWAGIVTVVLGVLVLLAWVIIRASVHVPEPAVRTLSEVHQRHAGKVGQPSLSDLVAMHDRGDLTDEEFAAAKRSLLGL